MSNCNLLYAFLGGAVVGAVAALLLAPEKGEDLRAHIKEILKRKGIDLHKAEIEELIERLKTEVEK